MRDDEIAVHLSPARRDRSDHVIHADIREPGLARTAEQLWARARGPLRFEICCVPFFVYDLALGDVVETDESFVVRRVVEPSGAFTFRVAFLERRDAALLDAVLADAREFGCTPEWYSARLLAISAPDRTRARQISGALAARQERGELTYETGRTA